ncbi:MAG: hypothetical protein RIC11_06630 [Botrimarina sp.]
MPQGVDVERAAAVVAFGDASRGEVGVEHFQQLGRDIEQRRVARKA